MPTEAETVMQEMSDLAKFASSEACKRIMDIADVLDDNHLKLMVGMSAARTLYISFLVSAINKGMPHEAAECFVRDTIGRINRHIDELNKESEKKQ